MAVQDEINAVRRLIDTINRQATSNAQTLGKLTPEIAALNLKMAEIERSALRAIQMCNELTSKVAALERLLVR